MTGAGARKAMGKGNAFIFVSFLTFHEDADVDLSSCEGLRYLIFGQSEDR